VTFCSRISDDIADDNKIFPMWVHLGMIKLENILTLRATVIWGMMPCSLEEVN
jgi:hypothetical protein